MASETLTLQIP